MKGVILPIVIAALVCAAPAAAWAQPPTHSAVSSAVAADQPDYFGKKTVPQKVSFRQARTRTRKQQIVLASLFGAAVVFGGLGLYFHLDSRHASNEISFVGGTPRRTYDRSVADTRDRAMRSRTLAIVGYSISGALLVATIVAMAKTQPGEEIVTIDDEKAPATTVPVSFMVVPGGAIVGKVWRF